MKKWTILLVLNTWVFMGFAQDNPYASFGYTPNITYETTTRDLFTYTNWDTASDVKKIVFNYYKGTLSFVGDRDSVLDVVAMQPEQLYRFLSPDPAEQEYPCLSPYAFVANNPLNAIDPDGQRVLFVNGYYNTGNLKGLAGGVGGETYWGPDFATAAKNYFNDQSVQFVDGRGKWNSTGAERYNAGYAYAQANFQTLTTDMVEGETFKVVSHSMGAAYAEGMIKYLEEKGMKVEKVVHFSPADPGGFKASTAPQTLQLNIENDIVLGYKNFDEHNMIGGIDLYGEVKTSRTVGQDWENSHADTKWQSNVFNGLRDLEAMRFTFTGNTTERVQTGDPGFGPSLYQTLRWGNYSAAGSLFGTLFNTVYQDGSRYSGTANPNTFTGPAK